MPTLQEIAAGLGVTVGIVALWKSTIRPFVLSAIDFCVDRALNKDRERIANLEGHASDTSVHLKKE